jgi:myo-inositol-1(or 4)-monophosphatase
MQRTREIVESVVREAGRYIRGRFGRLHDVDYKGETDLVTEVDRRSEAMIRRVIEREFPADSILAEESGIREGEGSGRRWIVDPLDGTTNFAHAYPFIAISVALEEAGRIVYGVVYDPLRDELFSAGRDRGATMNGGKIRVSPTREIGAGLIATGFPYDFRKRPDHHVEDLGRILRHVRGIRRDGSAALDLCYVACGRFDGFYERKLAPWDTAAGMLIVREAGGRVTTIAGGDYSIDPPEILATNGRIHEAMVDILATGSGGAPGESSSPGIPAG